MSSQLFLMGEKLDLRPIPFTGWDSAPSESRVSCVTRVVPSPLCHSGLVSACSLQALPSRRPCGRCSRLGVAIHHGSRWMKTEEREQEYNGQHVSAFTRGNDLPRNPRNTLPLSMYCVSLLFTCVKVETSFGRRAVSSRSPKGEGCPPPFFYEPFLCLAQCAC
jgi:hypothetical protein